MSRLQVPLTGSARGGVTLGAASGAIPAGAVGATIVVPQWTQNFAPGWVSLPHVVHFIAVLPMHAWKAGAVRPLNHLVLHPGSVPPACPDWRPGECSLSGWILLKLQFPRFCNQLAAETVMRFCRASRESCAFVDSPRGKQLTLRPQHDLAIPCSPRKAHAFVDQSSP